MRLDRQALTQLEFRHTPAEEVLYLPRATYPVSIRGLGGRSVDYARRLHESLGRLLAMTE
jgi:hypothetical protein